MNKNLKEFFLRGMLFGGFGPIIAAIIYLILSYTENDFLLSGKEAFYGIISTYLLAFVHAGSSVFNQIERWSTVKAFFCQLSLLYIAYIVCYLVNSWIPFDYIVIAIFTAIFVGSFIVIWLTVYLCTRLASKQLNKKMS